MNTCTHTHAITITVLRYVLVIRKILYDMMIINLPVNRNSCYNKQHAWNIARFALGSRSIFPSDNTPNQLFSSSDLSTLNIKCLLSLVGRKWWIMNNLPQVVQFTWSPNNNEHRDLAIYSIVLLFLSRFQEINILWNEAKETHCYLCTVCW